MKKLWILIIFCSALSTFSNTFSINLSKGDHFITIVSSTQTVIRNVGGEQSQVDNSTKITLSFEVIDSNDKTCSLAMRFKRIIASSKGAGWAYKYDTAPKPENSLESGSREMSNFYRELIGQTITIILDPKTGTIINMSGWDTLIKHMAESLKQGNRKNRMKLAKMLISSIQNGMTNGGPSSIFLPIGGKEIKVGNQWSIQSNLSTFSGLTLTTTYKVAETLPDKVRFNIKATLSTASKVTPIETGTTKIRYQLNGTQTGTITVDKNTGWIISSSIRQELQGTMTMIDMGITIPIQMEGKTEIRTLKETGQSRN